MNWSFCPHCETQLDEATGICPACRWDPNTEPPAREPEPELSLMERYRGTQYDSGYTSARAIVRSRRSTGATSRAKVMMLAGALVLFGLYGGMIAYSQLKESSPPAPATMTVP